MQRLEKKPKEDADVDSHEDLSPLEPDIVPLSQPLLPIASSVAPGAGEDLKQRLLTLEAENRRLKTIQSNLESSLQCPVCMEQSGLLMVISIVHHNCLSYYLLVYIHNDIIFCSSIYLSI